MTATAVPGDVGRDRRLVYVAAFLRALATGVTGVLAGIYLGRVGLDLAMAGFVIAAGLAGGAVAMLFVTFAGDRLGPRRLLIGLGALGAIGGTVFAFASRPGVLGAAAFLGMVNGMGRDRSGAAVLEQAMLPALSDDRARTRTFAWYNLLQDAGHALGALLAGLPALLRGAGLSDLASIRVGVASSVPMMAIAGLLYVGLSARHERPDVAARAPVSRDSRTVLMQLSGLFALDALGSGFLTTALLSYFFYERFGVSEAIIGPLFFGARVANALSHLGAAWLASRIGLVRTMVFTHVPSSLLLGAVPFAPTFLAAAVLFILREALVEMDVPTRQSYVMAVVHPRERTVASGVTNLVRLGGWAVAPALAGVFMRDVALATPLFVGAGMKLLYDLVLYVAFVGRSPAEEGARRRTGSDTGPPIG